MNRLFKKKPEKKKSLWKKVVDLALTDVRVAAGGMDHESLEELEERLLAADFGVPATLRLVDHVEELARRGKVRGLAGLREALVEEVRIILQPSVDAELQAAERHARGRRVRLGLTPWLRAAANLLDNYFLRMAILDGRGGVRMTLIHARYTFDKYALLRELSRKNQSA